MQLTYDEAQQNSGLFKTANKRNQGSVDSRLQAYENSQECYYESFDCRSKERRSSFKKDEYFNICNDYYPTDEGSPQLLMNKTSTNMLFHNKRLSIGSLEDDNRSVCSFIGSRRGGASESLFGQKKNSC